MKNALYTQFILTLFLLSNTGFSQNTNQAIIISDLKVDDQITLIQPNAWTYKSVLILIGNGG
jgi:hypothetical protein